MCFALNASLLFTSSIFLHPFYISGAAPVQTRTRAYNTITDAICLCMYLQVVSLVVALGASAAPDMYRSLQQLDRAISEQEEREEAYDEREDTREDTREDVQKKPEDTTGVLGFYLL